MKSYRKEPWFKAPTRMAFINTPPMCRVLARERGARRAGAGVNAMHITASVFINDDERGLHHDYGVWLEKLAP